MTSSVPESSRLDQAPSRLPQAAICAASGSVPVRCSMDATRQGSHRINSGPALT